MSNKYKYFVAICCVLVFTTSFNIAHAHKLSDLIEDKTREVIAISNGTNYTPRFTEADHKQWAALLIKNAPDLYLKQRTQRALNVNNYAPPNSDQAAKAMINGWERTAIKLAAKNGEMSFYGQVSYPLKFVTIGSCAKNITENEYECSLKDVKSVCLNQLGYVPTGLYAAACSLSVGVNGTQGRIGHFYKLTDGTWIGY